MEKLGNIIRLAAVVILTAAAAVSSAKKESVTGTLELTSDRILISDAGTPVEVALDANVEWRLEYDTANGWMSTDLMGGKASTKSFTVKGTENAGESLRSAKIRIFTIDHAVEKEITVIQLSAYPAIAFQTTATMALSYKEKEYEVAFTATIPVADITCEVSADWLTGVSLDEENSMLVFTAAENPEMLSRQAYIVLSYTDENGRMAEAILKVEQEAAAGLTYRISTADDLLAVSGKEYTVDDRILLESDIDMTGKEWTPFALTCTLDGQGHKIYGIVSDAGFFISEVAEGAVLENVVFGSSDGEAHDGTSKITLSGNPASVGAVAVNRGTVENVTTFADISIEINGDSERIGGVVGTNYSVIKGCTNHGNIDVTGKAKKKPWIGGIVGRMESECTGVEDCVNTGDITVDNSMVQTASGIAGILQGGNIIGCDNSGNITVTSSEAWSYFSGIVSFVQSQESAARTVVQDCHNTGNIKAEGAYAKSLGGIVAVMYSSSYHPLTISGCTNSGSLSLTGKYHAANNTIVGMGGIIGSSEYGKAEMNEIGNCENTGDILFDINAADYSKYLDCLPFVGGIAGNVTASMEISGCKNSGEVKAEAPVAQIGGVAGNIGNSVSISANDNSGAVTLDLGTETQYDFKDKQIGVAGLVGAVTGEGSTVSENTNSGNVAVTANASVKVNIDGAVAIPGSAAVSDNANTGTVTGK